MWGRGSTFMFLPLSWVKGPAAPLLHSALGCKGLVQQASWVLHERPLSKKGKEKLSLQYHG